MGVYNGEKPRRMSKSILHAPLKEGPVAYSSSFSSLSLGEIEIHVKSETYITLHLLAFLWQLTPVIRRIVIVLSRS